jgi:hypothetical protein
MMPVIDKDRGWNRIVRDSFYLGRHVSRVGFPDDGEPYEKGQDTTALTVALVHEFGAPNANIPERPFVRTAYDENVEAITTRAAEALGRVIDGLSTPEHEIAKLGEMHAADIQRKIQTGPFYPLKHSTVARKKSDRPLIDTGHMIQSVTHVEERR